MNTTLPRGLGSFSGNADVNRIGQECGAVTAGAFANQLIQRLLDDFSFFARQL